MTIWGKLLNWYFTKAALPYWCLLIIDFVIVFISVLFTYWLFNRTGVMFEERVNVFLSALLYVALSSIGAKAFHTYAGIVRYSHLLI